jgi:dTDP-4-dehydrorhamnose reductase
LYISQNAALAGTGPVVAVVALVEEEESAAVLSADAGGASEHDIAAHIATNARIDTNRLQVTERLDSPSPLKKRHHSKPAWAQPNKVK